jgi:hypothetical protein
MRGALGLAEPEIRLLARQSAHVGGDSGNSAAPRLLSRAYLGGPSGCPPACSDHTGAGRRKAEQCRHRKSADIHVRFPATPCRHCRGDTLIPIPGIVTQAPERRELHISRVPADIGAAVAAGATSAAA